MDWIIGGVLTVAALVGIWKFLGWQPLGRNKGREDFEHAIKSLLILMENGASLQVQRRGGDLFFDFLRVAGKSDTDAVVVLRIPRAPWSDAYRENLHAVFDAHDFEARMVEEAGSEVLMEINIPVEDIWEEWCGARSARAGHLFLDTLSVPKDARFDCSLIGGPSKRWRQHDNQLRQAERI